jgi:ankyrin repeat protein
MRLLLCVLNLITMMSCTNRDKIVDKEELLGNDYRLFQQTPLWDLAKAVEDENILEIRRIVKESKINIDYQEKKFGNTLLMLTVTNQQFESCQALLDLGANPNLYDNYDGSSAIIDATAINETIDDNTKFLKLLLAHGGDPNFVEVGDRREGNTTRYTPLIMACSNTNKLVSPLEKVRILIEAGADINYKNEFGCTALKEAYIQENFDVVIYLLKKGADYKIPLFNRNEKDIFIWDDLRDLVYQLDSKEYHLKMEIVDFLKSKGIDYRKIPIPDYIVDEIKEDYPSSWKEFLKLY